MGRGAVTGNCAQKAHTKKRVRGQRTVSEGVGVTGNRE